MAPVKDFLAAIDAGWRPIGDEPITLQIVGSTALMLQADYTRGTKDSDVLESSGGPLPLKERLLALAGRETDLHKRFRLYIDVIDRAILFLPQQPEFRPLQGLALKNFKIEVLAVNDVVLSKLKRYNRDDTNDIRTMAAKGLIDHNLLIEPLSRRLSF
ncbi:MAG: hypothetical protein HY549_05230 [Elusimicrobia bacterium]|nr:hypothetical protein [Elusimicrobiota bacterium]